MGGEKKPLHTKYCNRASDPDVDQTHTHEGLPASGLKPKTQ